MHLLVDSKLWYRHPPAGFTVRIRLVVNENDSFDFQVLLRLRARVLSHDVTR